jgi:hypothetical protein
MNDIEFCASILERIKKEVDKRNVLYDYGVDLINYENEYTSCLMDSLCFILNKIKKMNWKEEIEWWLYEAVEKVIYYKDNKVSVETAQQLLNFLIVEMETL